MPACLFLRLGSGLLQGVEATRSRARATLDHGLFMTDPAWLLNSDLDGLVVVIQIRSVEWGDCRLCCSDLLRLHSDGGHRGIFGRVNLSMSNGCAVAAFIVCSCWDYGKVVATTVE